MLKKFVIITVGVVFFLFGVNSAFAWDGGRCDPSVPGTWRICETNTVCNMDFGIIFYSESITTILSDGTQMEVREYPISWDFYYGDFFIFEMPDAGGFEDEESLIESIPTLPSDCMLAQFKFWEF